MSQPPDDLDEFTRIGPITVRLSAELDRTTMSFEDVAGLGPGSLIRLNSSAGETISIHIGDVRIGFGEVLLVDGVLTVRVAELLEPPPASEAEDTDNQPAPAPIAIAPVAVPPAASAFLKPAAPVSKGSRP